MNRHVLPEFDDDGEDLSSVLGNVRRNRLQRTRAEWANDWRTRNFCRLGLQILYDHHIVSPGNTSLDGVQLFTPLSAEALARKAQEVIPDPRLADQMTAQRWVDTWGNRLAYTEDLLYYLFRPAPHLRQLENVFPQMVDHAKNHTLGDFLRFSATLWENLIPWDGLLSLQNLVKSCLPGNTLVLDLGNRLVEMSRGPWISMYREVFSVYDAHLQPPLRWDDLAEAYYVCAEGARTRIRCTGDPATLADGENLFAYLLRSIAASMVGTRVDDLDALWPTDLRGS